MAYTSTTTANSVTTTCTIASDISVHPSTRTMPHVLTESKAHISGMENLNPSSVIFLPTIVNNQITSWNETTLSDITSALSGSQKSRDSDSLTTQTSSVEREISSSSEDKVLSVNKELSSAHETHVDETTDREHLLSGDTTSTTPQSPVSVISLILSDVNDDELDMEVDEVDEDGQQYATDENLDTDSNQSKDKDIADVTRYVKSYFVPQLFSSFWFVISFDMCGNPLLSRAHNSTQTA